MYVSAWDLVFVAGFVGKALGLTVSRFDGLGLLNCHSGTSHGRERCPKGPRTQIIRL